ncbi:pectinesterase family protein, partial [Bacteroidales bacterium OttesenSCG-928-J19]|nr:pectinesterase family protein [Bacteroidales bacterium OttesenSCG-928-J19]
SAGFYIYGTDFTAIDITFENTAGPIGQAVAVYTLGDKITFVNCRFLGFQDTLYAAGNGGRQYYKNCYIEGTTDFIFGSGTAWFEECHIHCKANSYITAANTPEEVEYGYIFNHCRITADPQVTKVYLGRPWRPYAMTLFMNTLLPDFIAPEGWHNWGKESNEQTARYMEYNNSGAGSKMSKRVKWGKNLSKKDASGITLQAVMQRSDAWDPIANKRISTQY